MSTVKLAVVVVAYNRVDSLKRLLETLDKVDYRGDDVPLIISIDYSGNNAVYEFSDSFVWNYGEKKIIQHKVNLGLKKHVLSCGDLVRDYDAIIVLEDDLIVSESMYSYAKCAVQKYQDVENIEAISLYGKIWSETAERPFIPALSVYDTYFIQTAESLGQVWFKNKWKRFRKWYEENSECGFEPDKIPLNVCQWDDKSWKKYHIKYCIDKNKFTVYPYQALSTCMGDVGEHTESSTSVSQVPLASGGDKSYRFALFNSEDSIKYDAFLERILPENDDVCMDLYGWKRDFSGYKYVISSQIMNYKVVDSFGLALRPHEENIIKEIAGSDFFKYDLSQNEENPRRENREKIFKYYYYSDFSHAMGKMLITEMLDGIFVRIKSKIRKFFRRKKADDKYTAIEGRRNDVK